MKKTKECISNIILVIAICVFGFSGYKLYQIQKEYKGGTSEYETLQDTVVQIDIPKVEQSDDSKKETEEIVFRIDFEKLMSINSEVVAWLRFDNPDTINYPVVQGDDNAKYLKTTFEGKRNSSGTLFVDVENAGDFSDRNTFIYGHNMKNGAMFGKLRKYKDSAFCRENPYFYIYTPDGTEHKYQVFAASVVKDTSESYMKTYADITEFQAYIDYIRSISIYKTDVEVSEDAKIVSLSTCTNVQEDERLLVHGVKVSERMADE